MSKKISIIIPAQSGDQAFHFGKRSILAILATLTTVPALLGTFLYQQYNDSQLMQSEMHTTQQEFEAAISNLKTEKKAIEALYEEQVDTSHSLSQSLEQKNSQIHILGKRVYDVESVLGLADEDLLTNDSSLEERIDAAAIDSAVRATMFRLIPNDSPVTYQRISSSYGRRTNPISGKRHTHTGIDLTCKRGEQILAPADGVVETVRPSKKGFGNFLTVRHSFGFMSSYAHLKSFKAKSGQFVSKGDVLATCGNSGNSTGPHLHYEVRFLGRSLNPQYLMDWTPENFNYVFEKEKKLKWAPLVKLIDNMVRLQINLTNAPYTDSSIETVLSDDTNDKSSITR